MFELGTEDQRNGLQAIVVFTWIALLVQIAWERANSGGWSNLGEP